MKGANKLNQTEARHTLYEVFSNAGNVEQWDERPASPEQKNKIRFFGERVTSGLKFTDAAKTIDDMARSNIERLGQWDELRSGFENAVDPEMREDYDIKRFSWKQFCEVVRKMEEEGRLLTDIVSDEEQVYEALLKEYPTLGK